ncbi:hypothetical protein BDB01DRAFT_853445 [Pilobolus umbonatus]|nr:hypothetical protein BDB01DRAFT_853445 [Pilobolus umbonatus]
MKRANESANQNVSDAKKARYAQSMYADVYSQYGMMSQYATANPYTPAATTAFNGYAQPTASMYNMNYGGQNMMASQYGTPAAYSQAFVTPTASGFPTTVASTDVSRTIYLGNVPKDAEPHEILKYVKTGMVESFKIIPEKSCAFLAFVDPNAAQAFYHEFLQKKMSLHGTDIRIGWGKPTLVPNTVKHSIQGGATRNVYLGHLDASHTEDTIKNDLIRFGPIEQIKLIREKNIAFVHFLSVASAVKCVNALPTEPAWINRRVNYGKDHCQATMDNSSYGFNFQSPFSQNFTFDPYNQSQMMGQGYGMRTTPNAPSSCVLRTLYVGNIHPEASCEDLCNSIRGGNLLQIRYFPEKHIAFVTFMDGPTAVAVFNHANTHGLVVKGKRLRVGWGKPSTITTQISQAVQAGATRNIYIGGIDDNLTEEKLRSDFSVYGEIELVNFLKEKTCAFVNFTTVSAAINAINGIREKPEYATYKINYGKDRCGNPPKHTFREEKHGKVEQDEIKQED